MDQRHDTTGPIVLSRAERARRQMLAEQAPRAGQRSQATGRGHRWTAADAKHWGRLGGQCSQLARRRSANFSQ